MRVAVLNSAQPKRPCGLDPWVRATLQAVDATVRAGHTLVTSVGLNTWELVLWRAAERGARVHVVVPLTHSRCDPEALRASLSEEFRLCSGRTSWSFVAPAPGARGRKAAWSARDAHVVRTADGLVPVAVRRGGRLAQWLEARRGDQPMDCRHVTEYRASSGAGAWVQRRPRQLAQRVTLLDSPLFHLTRGSEGPWPGERAWQYYEAVAESRGDPRSGFHTLCRIIREHRIRATPFRMPGAASMVSFTACDGPSLAALVRGRRRYARYAFEPYAIAVERSVLERAGARAVDYRSRPERREHSRSPWEQGAGPNNVWLSEREWRHAEDVDLGQLPPGSWCAVTATAREAEALRGWFRGPVCWLGYAEPDERKKRTTIDASGAVQASKGM